MHERNRAGFVQPINMEPQVGEESLVTRPQAIEPDQVVLGRESKFHFFTEKAQKLAHGAKDAYSIAKKRGVRTFAAAAVLSSSILGACEFGTETAPPSTPLVTPIERTLPPGVHTATETVVPITKTPPATETATPSSTETVQPTDTPEETPTIETPSPTETVGPTETPTIDPTTVTPTKTPTQTETPVESQLPYEIGSELTVGNITLAVEKALQTRTECPDPQNLQNMISCNAMQELYLNTDEFPNAADKLQEGVKFGLYNAWVEEGQGDKTVREKMTFEQFKAELANERGQDLTFQVSGINNENGHDLNGIITIDPRVDDLNFLWIAQPEAFSRLTTATSVEIRKIGNNVYIPMYQFDAGGVENNDPQQLHPYKYQASGQIAIGLFYLAIPALQEANPDYISISKNYPFIKELVDRFIPIKTSDNWNGIVLAK